MRRSLKLSLLLTLIFFLPTANASDVASQGLALCNSAYQSCEAQREDFRGLYKVEHEENGSLRLKLSAADEKAAEQATRIPGIVWGLGGAAVAVVVVEGLRIIFSKR